MELVAAYLQGRALQRERHYRDPLDPLHVNDNQLLRYYRFPRHEILWLCEVLDPYLRRTRRSHAVPTHTQVLVALRFYASGTFQSVIGDSCGLTQASVSRIIAAVTRVLTEKARIEIKFPSSANDLMKTVQDFSRFANLPRVIGAIDGTHIPIKAPYVDEHIYVNRKRFHSLNLQVVCNADGLIISYNTRYPGSTHDAFIWSNCALRDSGYPLEPYLLTPLSNPRTPGETRYNRSNTRTRGIIEQTCGILKSRFKCLHHSGRTLQCDPVKCSKIAITCLLLHNYCVKRRIPIPQEIAENDGEVNIAAKAAERGTGRAVRARLTEN
ncbi:putative nuclease HARBI1 [Penaeus indicus]|uniref:putative nuclease HARBI1 n=1 Tax=Penaeus indicus TaxID=29960 RepID=UPI00300D0C83